MLEEPMMTEAQRDELKTLCLKADVPDKSGELLTQEGAQHFIDEEAIGGTKIISVCGRCGRRKRGRRMRGRTHRVWHAGSLLTAPRNKHEQSSNNCDHHKAAKY